MLFIAVTAGDLQDLQHVWPLRSLQQRTVHGLPLGINAFRKGYVKIFAMALGCVCKPSSRNRVTTGKCATMTSLKTSGSGLSPYCQQKVLLVEGDRLVTSETFSMLYIGCCEPDLHGELCQRNMVRGKPYIPDSGVGRKEDIWLLS